jgi:hypothetical protein
MNHARTLLSKTAVAAKYLAVPTIVIGSCAYLKIEHDRVSFFINQREEEQRKKNNLITMLNKIDRTMECTLSKN